MRIHYFYLALLSALAASPVFYLDQQHSDPHPSGLESSPYQSLTAALMSIPDLYVEIQFVPGSAAAPYNFSTLGMHLTVRLVCNENSIDVTGTILVGPMAVAEFDNCHFVTSLTANAMMIVLGSASVAGGSVQNSPVKGFILYGTLAISETLFTGNRDSIFAAQAFGFNLHVARATFQLNTSPVGVVLLFGISGVSSNSSTEVLIEDCAFVGNGAYMGGSFLYMNVNPTIEFSPSQLSQSRSVTVRNSVFNTNPGYLCIVLSKFVNVTFSGNDYTTHDNGFLLQLFDSSFALTDSSVHTIGRLLISSYIAGLVTVKSVDVSDVTEGSAIILRNSAPMAAGFVSIVDVAMHRVFLSNVALLSASLFAFNVAISVVSLRVDGGYSYACGCGCFVFSAAIVTAPVVESITVEQGAILAFLYADGKVSDAYLRNVTLKRVSYSGVFMSNVSFRNVTFAPGNSSYLLFSVMANMFVAFDSYVYIYGAYYDLPPMPSSPAFYVWSTVAECYNITFPVLFSKLTDMYSISTIYLRNITVGRGAADCFILISFRCSAVFEEFSISNTVVKLAMFSALSESNFTIRKADLTNVRMPAIAIASKSKMSLSDISLKNVEADTLFWYISTSEMSVHNLTVSDSTFDLMQFYGGKISFSSIDLRGVTVRRRFMLIRQAIVEFTDFVIVNLTATRNTPFCLVQQSSLLTFRSGRMEQFRSREQGMMEIRDSSVRFAQVVIEDFNVTFAVAVNSDITVDGSVVSCGGLKLMDTDSKAKVSAGFIDAKDSTIALRDSDFRNVSGTNGGVISLTSGKKRSEIDVKQCSFWLCSAEKDGGAIRAIATDVMVASSSFANSSADRGAGIYFECDSADFCKSAISQCTFVNNTAREGGGVKWTIVRPTFTAVLAEHNTVVYGPFEASVATRMTLGNSNGSSMRGVAGVVVIEPILIAFLDVINQTVATDNKSAAKLISDRLIGTTYLVAKDGVANFAGVIVQTTPGTSVAVQAFSPTINATFPGSPGALYSFSYETRKCIPGEVSSNKGCYLCPKNTFSVNPMESECRACPRYATCPGGLSLILNGGYWRLSELSSDVYVCPIRGACDGGQKSTCAGGYSDRLCAKCELGYYAAGLMYCMECEALAVRAVRIAIFLLIVIIVYALVIRKSTSSHISSKSVAVLTTVKILFNFFQSVLMISLINVDWKSVMMGLFSANEMFVSFAVTSLTMDCFHCKAYTQMET